MFTYIVCIGGLDANIRLALLNIVSVITDTQVVDLQPSVAINDVGTRHNGGTVGPEAVFRIVTYLLVYCEPVAMIVVKRWISMTSASQVNLIASWL